MCVLRNVVELRWQLEVRRELRKIGFEFGRFCRRLANRKRPEILPRSGCDPVDERGKWRSNVSEILSPEVHVIFVGFVHRNLER